MDSAAAKAPSSTPESIGHGIEGQPMLAKVRRSVLARGWPPSTHAP